MKIEVFESICTEIETTILGIVKICEKNGTTWAKFRTMILNPDNMSRYARARQLQIDYLEDLILQLAFEIEGDKKVIDGINIGSNSIARNRLQIDTLKFILSKLRSNTWGAKIEHTVKSEPRVFNID